jgi:hypothetical protein
MSKDILACAYYDPVTKNRCAVGCLLTEETAERLSNTVTGIEELVADNPVVASELEGISMDFLLDAQLCHDSADNWSESGFDVGELDFVARTHGLRMVK